MKTKIFTLLTLVSTILAGFTFSTNIAKAQVSQNGTEPTVPISVGRNGRKAVTDYLLGKIDHVVIHYSGRSIIGNGWQDQYLDNNYLQYVGYVHKVHLLN